VKARSSLPHFDVVPLEGAETFDSVRVDCTTAAGAAPAAGMFGHDTEAGNC